MVLFRFGNSNLKILSPTHFLVGIGHDRHTASVFGARTSQGFVQYWD
ncbi:hypothetical protein SAMN04487868_105200 [Marinobacter salarius]|jgi:hypothetical protein|uniref:Uncharacterized protein n=1 Tax=Marinobacter salarius TaxID=1420917 RepID=A0ABY1FMD0_9GAMM|nr:hypothetical protein SAMN04487868_105200 [Marinobacter salarius]